MAKKFSEFSVAQGIDNLQLVGIQNGDNVKMPASNLREVTNLKNGIPLNSLRQKDTTYVSLNAYIRPAVVAYLMSLGLPQAQAEIIADSDASVEGSTRSILAGLGITGDLTNTVYAALATAFGAGHTIGSPTDPQQGMGSVAMGLGLDITGKICLGVGKKQTYSVDMFTDPADKAHARLFLVNLKSAGEFDTTYDNEQIIAGLADNEVFDFGAMSGDSSFMVGASNVKGVISGAIGNINVIGEGVQNCLAVGTQNLVVGHANFVSGLINYVGGTMNLVSGDRNKTSHSMCGVIGSNLETGADYQSIFGHHNLKNASALLQVGNGSGNNRSNAFVVLEDGRAKVYGAPLELEDVTNKGYVDSLKGVYDVTIKTQEQFNTMIDSETWLDAKSVALIGQFTLNTANNGGVKIPDTVKQIHGYNGAKITITNFAYDETTAKGGLWYEEKPEGIDCEIRNLEVDCTGTGPSGDYPEVSGFFNCTNLTNCTGTGSGGNLVYGFRDCTNLTNCTGTGNGDSDAYGFQDCTNLTNCTGTASGYDSCYGFYNCSQLTNCTGTGSGGSCYGFYNCSQLTNCTGTGSGGSGYGFYNCSYANGCKAGTTPSSISIWGGTNLKIDEDSCEMNV